MFFKDVNSVTDVDTQFEQILRICEDPNNANNQTSKEDDPNEASSENNDSKDDDISLEGQNPGDEDATNSEEGRKMTRSGRISKKPKNFDDYVTTAADLCEEFLGIGAGAGEGIMNTMELQVKTYRQAMKSPDKDKWLAAVEEEYQRLIKHNVWTPVDKSTISKDDKVMTTTWAMKKKANGTYRARLNARGYEQVEGMHYDTDSLAAPVTNDTTIRVAYVLAGLAGWKSYVVNVQGAFLNGRFEARERLFLKIPERFESKYSDQQVLKLN
jgi:Reverse transcriptase (RNA-dependent DNA polymerase)